MNHACHIEIIFGIGCRSVPRKSFDEGSRGTDAARAEQELGLFRRVDSQQCTYGTVRHPTQRFEDGGHFLG